MKLLKWLWRRWVHVARKIGEFQSRVILTIFYFVFMGPFALVMKLFSDPLRLKTHREDSHWVIRETKETKLDEARKQF